MTTRRALWLRLLLALALGVGLAAVARIDRLYFAYDELGVRRRTDPPAGPAVEAEVEALLGRMTLTEKLAQLSGVGKMRGRANRRLDIPSLQAADGPHGIGEAVWRLYYRDFDRSTSFPVSMALASTWSPELAYEAGAAIAREARAKGRNWLLAPNLNLVRDPRHGRSFESFGEDPYLTSRLGVGYVRGVQDQGVIATPKHFVAHHQEWFRRFLEIEVPERALRELYLPAFEAVVREGGALSLMAASHSINGAHCTENEALLQTVLKDEWGFAGFVTSDWNATQSTLPSFSGGLDLEMPTALHYGEPLAAALRHGEADPARLDDHVSRILRSKLQAGLFDRKRELAPSAVSSEASRELALRVARESLILLRNEGGALPLSADEPSTIFVTGPNAAVARLSGRGSAVVKPIAPVSPLAGLRRLLGGSRVAHLACCDERTRDTEQRLRRAGELAAAAETALVFVGLDDFYEGEARDRWFLTLPEPQDRLVAAVAANNPRTIVVVVTGSAVAMPGWLPEVEAVVYAFYPGELGGIAIADALYGRAGFSGKLPLSLPRSREQLPAAHTFGKRQQRYDEGPFIGYRWLDAKGHEPLFPFGHGLSYSRFEYSGLELEVRRWRDEKVTARFRVRNAGERAATEVAQLYLSDLQSTLPRPPQELVAFRRFELAPGEETEVEIGLGLDALDFWDQGEWQVEAGEFELRVGSSSRDIRLRQTFRFPP